MVDESKSTSAKSEEANQQLTLLHYTEKLASQIEELNASVDKATEVKQAIEDLSAQGTRNRRLIIALALSFALDLLLTIAMAFSFTGLAASNDKLDVLTQRLNQEQKVQKDEALCPMFQIFQDATEPAIRAASENVPGYDKEKILKSFDTIHKVYDALNCKALLAGK